MRHIFHFLESLQATCRCSSNDGNPAGYQIANRILSVTKNDAVKRDYSGSLGHATCKHRHATHARVFFFFDGGLRWATK